MIPVSSANSSTDDRKSHKPAELEAIQRNISADNVFYHFNETNTQEVRKENMPMMKCVVEGSEINCDKNAVGRMINLPLLNYWRLNTGK